jgi:Cu/Ag efflux protein CusF
MKNLAKTTARWLWLSVLVSVPVLSGCKGRPNDVKEFNLAGVVVAIGRDRQEVTLDHEGIPGFNVKAGKMSFRLARPELLEGIGPGDRVQGLLEVKGVKPLPTVMTLTRLEKQP